MYNKSPLFDAEFHGWKYGPVLSEVVTLTSDGAHRDIIKNFCAKPEGKGLEQFLKELAWDEDERGSTKVYLVKEKTTGSIVFFFALKAGLLYKEIGFCSICKIQSLFLNNIFFKIRTFYKEGEGCKCACAICTSVLIKVYNFNLHIYSMVVRNKFELFLNQRN